MMTLPKVYASSYVGSQETTIRLSDNPEVESKLGFIRLSPKTDSPGTSEASLENSQNILIAQYHLSNDELLTPLNNSDTFTELNTGTRDCNKDEHSNSTLDNLFSHDFVFSSSHIKVPCWWDSSESSSVRVAALTVDQSSFSPESTMEEIRDLHGQYYVDWIDWLQNQNQPDHSRQEDINIVTDEFNHVYAVFDEYIDSVINNHTTKKFSIDDDIALQPVHFFDEKYFSNQFWLNEAIHFKETIDVKIKSAKGMIRKPAIAASVYNVTKCVKYGDNVDPNQSEDNKFAYYTTLDVSKILKSWFIRIQPCRRKKIPVSFIFYIIDDNETFKYKRDSEHTAPNENPPNFRTNNCVNNSESLCVSESRENLETTYRAAELLHPHGTVSRNPKLENLTQKQPTYKHSILHLLDLRNEALIRQGKAKLDIHWNLTRSLWNSARPLFELSYRIEGEISCVL